MHRVAAVRSGFGVHDGAEVSIALPGLLRLEQPGAGYECFAPETEAVFERASGEHQKCPVSEALA